MGRSWGSIPADFKAMPLTPPVCRVVSHISSQAHLIEPLPTSCFCLTCLPPPPQIFPENMRFEARGAELQP